ncbi:hypothetical protein ANN_19662 [Periplaneta americana]|uniref:Uncharacterized protein n=1 Tax=Periplaneta americana TaxID=6978 RepID=A0ABQ8SAH8_PERAM|nr:hypothetical protein ANN_19662 [Periplaneta americana]
MSPGLVTSNAQGKTGGRAATLMFPAKHRCVPTPTARVAPSAPQTELSYDNCLPCSPWTGLVALYKAKARAARGYRSLIDYILVNKKMKHTVLDIRAYRGADVQSDHYLVTSKIRIPPRWQKSKKSTTPELTQSCYKVHLLRQDSIRKLYCKRLENYIDHGALSMDVNQEWEDLKSVIEKAAYESLGKRYKRRSKRGIKIWSEETKHIIEEKRKAYLKFLQTKSEADRAEYKYRCAMVKRETRKLSRQSWDNYISNIEYDIHGAQTMAYKALKHLNKEERDTVALNNVRTEDWLRYFKELWTTQHYEENLHVDKDTSVPVSDIDLIEYEEMEQILQSFSNNKSPGSDDLNIELLKYAPVGIKQRLLNILNICWITYKIPEEWRKAIVSVQQILCSNLIGEDVKAVQLHRSNLTGKSLVRSSLVILVAKVSAVRELLPHSLRKALRRLSHN